MSDSSLASFLGVVARPGLMSMPGLDTVPGRASSFFRPSLSSAGGDGFHS